MGYLQSLVNVTVWVMWGGICDEYLCKKGGESFPGDEGHDHIPEQSDKIGE